MVSCLVKWWPRKPKINYHLCRDVKLKLCIFNNKVFAIVVRVLKLVGVMVAVKYVLKCNEMVTFKSIRLKPYSSFGIGGGEWYGIMIELLRPPKLDRKFSKMIGQPGSLLLWCYFLGASEYGHLVLKLFHLLRHTETLIRKWFLLAVMIFSTIFIYRMIAVTKNQEHISETICRTYHWLG